MSRYHETDLVSRIQGLTIQSSAEAFRFVEGNLGWHKVVQKLMAGESPSMEEVVAAARTTGASEVEAGAIFTSFVRVFASNGNGNARSELTAHPPGPRRGSSSAPASRSRSLDAEKRKSGRAVSVEGKKGDIGNQELSPRRRRRKPEGREASPLLTGEDESGRTSRKRRRRKGRPIGGHQPPLPPPSMDDGDAGAAEHPPDQKPSSPAVPKLERLDFPREVAIRIQQLMEQPTLYSAVLGLLQITETPDAAAAYLIDHGVELEAELLVKMILSTRERTDHLNWEDKVIALAIHAGVSVIDVSIVRDFVKEELRRTNCSFSEVMRHFGELSQSYPGAPCLSDSEVQAVIDFSKSDGTWPGLRRLQRQSSHAG
ncbi:MAG: hypothetical protein Q8P95_05540 [bacterium]|nr:hypothetical protein [bacterium]